MANPPDLDAYKARIADLQAQVQELQKRLVTDELTQILNRRGLMDYLEAIASEVRFQQKHPDKRRSVVIKALSLIFIDIDHFKRINDTYGHDAGDAVLRQVADLIQDQVRQLDIVGRYGGEEIVVGLVGADEKNAARIAEILRTEIEASEFIVPNKDDLKLTASLGVAELTNEKSVAAVLKMADEALYRAKDEGRNRVIVA
jgi:diguanylate cyclase (GGDEF)-like protein